MVEPTVDFLAELAGGGPRSSSGSAPVGSRCRSRGAACAVHGIDLSEAMVARLRAKPGGEDIGVTIGDFATTTVDGTFSVAYLVFNTIMNLTTQDEQVACFRNAAAHLEPGGCFVIEVGVPALRRLPPGETVRAFTVSPTQLGFDEYDVATQGLDVAPLLGRRRRRSRAPRCPFRYVWPARARPDGAARRDDAARALGRLEPRALHEREPVARLGLGEDRAVARTAAGVVARRLDDMVARLSRSAVLSDDLPVGAASLVAASHLRRNRGSSALVVVLLAVVVAIVLAALAGARRTDRVVDDFVAGDAGAEGYVGFPPLGPEPVGDLAAEESAVAAVDGVERTARFSDAVVELSGPAVSNGPVVLQGWVGREPGGLAKASRLHLVAGRAADQARTDELLIDEELARDARLEVGSAVDLRLFTLEQLAAGSDARAGGFAVEAEVVGIVRRPTDLRDPQERQLVPNDYVVHQDVYLTTALWNAGGQTDIAGFTPFIGFDFEDGAEPRQVLAAITEATGGYAIDHARFLELDGTFNGVDRSASLHSRGLQAFAAAVAIAGLFLVGQTLGRQIVLEARDDGTLRALGLTPRWVRIAALLARPAGGRRRRAARRARRSCALAPDAVAGNGGPRRAELDPGVSVDPLVLVGGGLLAVVLATVASTLPSLRAVGAASRDQSAPRGRPGLASRLAARGLSAPAVIGIRFALEPGRGRTAVPVRTGDRDRGRDRGTGRGGGHLLVLADRHPRRAPAVRRDVGRGGGRDELRRAGGRLAAQVRRIPGVAELRGHVRDRVRHTLRRDPRGDGAPGGRGRHAAHHRGSGSGARGGGPRSGDDGGGGPRDR